MRTILPDLRRAGIALGGVLLLWQMLIGLQTLFDRAPIIFSLVYLFAAFGLVFLSYALQIVSWGVLMRGLQLSIPWKALFRGYILSFLPRYIPGSVWGYLSRSEWLRSEFQVGYAVSTSGSLLEITVALISAGWIAGIYAASLLDEPCGIILGLVLVPGVIWILVQRMLRVRWISHLVYRDSHCVTQAKLPLFNWLLSVAIIVCNIVIYGTALYLTARGLALDSPLSSSNIFTFVANYSIAWLIGFVAFFLPAGLGLREVTLSTLLALSLGLSGGKASLLAVLFRVIVTLAEILWVVISLVLRQRDKQRYIPNTLSDGIALGSKAKHPE
jgi:hypothetical protein